MSNRLPVLAEEIRRAHAGVQVAARTAAERAIEAGQALIEAKALVKHGGWLPWLREAGIGERTARNYMALARSGVKSATVADLGIKAALQSLATPREPGQDNGEGDEQPPPESVEAPEPDPPREPDPEVQAAIRAVMAEMDEQWEAAKAEFHGGGIPGFSRVELLAARWVLIFLGEERARRVVEWVPLGHVLLDAQERGHAIPSEIQPVLDEYRARVEAEPRRS